MNIIDAEVIETPKKWPELFIAVAIVDNEHWRCGNPRTSHASAVQSLDAYATRQTDFIVRVPDSTTPPTPKPEADAVDAITELCRLGHYVEFSYDGDDVWCSVRDAGRPPITQQSGATADIAADRCLAKIRGGK